MEHSAHLLSLCQWIVSFTDILAMRLCTVSIKQMFSRPVEVAKKPLLPSSHIFTVTEKRAGWDVVPLGWAVDWVHPGTDGLEAEADNRGGKRWVLLGTKARPFKDHERLCLCSFPQLDKTVCSVHIYCFWSELDLMVSILTLWSLKIPNCLLKTKYNRLASLYVWLDQFSLCWIYKVFFMFPYTCVVCLLFCLCCCSLFVNSLSHSLPQFIFKDTFNVFRFVRNTLTQSGNTGIWIRVFIGF